MFCPKCGAQTDNSTNFCCKCGYSFVAPPPPAETQFLNLPQKPPSNKIVTAGLIFSIFALTFSFAGPLNIFLYIAIALTCIGFIQTKKQHQKATRSLISACISLFALILCVVIIADVWLPSDNTPVNEPQPATTQEATTPKRVLDENELSIYKNDIAWNMTMDEVAEIVINSKYTYEQGNDYIKTSNIRIDFMAGSSISGNSDYIYSGVSKAYVFDDNGKLEKVEYIFPYKKGKDIDYIMVGGMLLDAYGIDMEQLSTSTNNKGHYVTDISTESERLIVYNDGTRTILDIIRK